MDKYRLYIISSIIILFCIVLLILLNNKNYLLLFSLLIFSVFIFSVFIDSNYFKIKKSENIIKELSTHYFYNELNILFGDRGIGNVNNIFYDTNKNSLEYKMFLKKESIEDFIINKDEWKIKIKEEEEVRKLKKEKEEKGKLEYKKLLEKKQKQEEEEILARKNELKRIEEEKRLQEELAQKKKEEEEKLKKQKEIEEFKEQQKLLQIKIETEKKEEELRLLKIKREKEEQEAEILRLKILEEEKTRIENELVEKRKKELEELKIKEEEVRKQKELEEQERLEKEAELKRIEEEKRLQEELAQKKKEEEEKLVLEQKRKEFKSVLHKEVNSLQISWRKYNDDLGVHMNTLVSSFPPKLTEFDRSVIMRKLAEEYKIMKDILRTEETFMLEKLCLPQEHLQDKIAIYTSLSQWHTQFLDEICHINTLNITNTYERLHRKKEAEEDYNYRRNTHCEELHIFPTILVYDELQEDIQFSINRDAEYMD